MFPFKVYVKQNDDADKAFKAAMMLFRNNAQVEEQDIQWIELILKNWYYTMIERSKHLTLKEGEYEECHLRFDFGGHHVKGAMVVMA